MTNLPAQIGLTLGFTLHQHLNAARQHGDFGFLSRDDIRKVIDRSGQVGNLFF